MYNTILFKFEVPERGKEKSPFYLGVGLLSLIFGLLVDGYLFRETITPTAYIPFVIMTGFLSRHLLSIAAVTALVTCSLYYINSSSLWGLDLFLLRWFNFFLLSFVVRLFVRGIQKERENVLNLTSTLAEAIDARDKYTSYHSKNVATYSKQIAKAMGLSRTQCRHIYIGGLLHDIGKIGVPESILNKPSRLTNEEFEVIKKHPEIGHKMLIYIPFFRASSILDMVLYHHERYDGRGYPSGLKGDAIPLVARIMAVADSFDAMTSRRVYRHTNDLDFAIDEIQRNRETQFDPVIADIFLDLIKKGEIEILGDTKLQKVYNHQ